MKNWVKNSICICCVTFNVLLYLKKILTNLKIPSEIYYSHPKYYAGRNNYNFYFSTFADKKYISLKIACSAWDTNSFYTESRVHHSPTRSLCVHWRLLHSKYIRFYEFRSMRHIAGAVAMCGFLLA